MNPPEMRRVEPVPGGGFVGRLWRQFWVQDHPAASRKKVCPSCHMFLPHKTANGELASEIVALVGARNAGKSNYFGVLLNSLEARYAGEVGFSFFAQETFSVREMKPISSRTLYQARYGARLFGS
ncbi:MAG TPA: hypothetical protein EYP56_17540, partial [Planctomycetaceae bacterium]|nr:hypothetical protein [Planctomycetaceae bacterium]